MPLNATDPSGMFMVKCAIVQNFKQEPDSGGGGPSDGEDSAPEPYVNGCGGGGGGGLGPDEIPGWLWPDIYDAPCQDVVLDGVNMGNTCDNEGGDPQARGGSGGGGGGGADNVNTAIRNAVQTALNVLNAANDCSNFFNQSAIVQANRQANEATGAPLLPQTAAQFMQTDRFLPDSRLAPTVGGGTIQGAELGQNAVVGINSHSNGAFLSHDYHLTDSRSPMTGTPVAQAVMVLHELAHTLLVIPPDGPGSGASPNQSINNTQTILNHCLGAIQAAVGH